MVRFGAVLISNGSSSNKPIISPREARIPAFLVSEDPEPFIADYLYLRR